MAEFEDVRLEERLILLVRQHDHLYNTITANRSSTVIAFRQFVSTFFTFGLMISANCLNCCGVTLKYCRYQTSPFQVLSLTGDVLLENKLLSENVWLSTYSPHRGKDIKPTES